MKIKMILVITMFMSLFVFGCSSKEIPKELVNEKIKVIDPEKGPVPYPGTYGIMFSSMTNSGNASTTFTKSEGCNVATTTFETSKMKMFIKDGVIIKYIISADGYKTVKLTEPKDVHSFWIRSVFYRQ